MGKSELVRCVLGGGASHHRTALPPRCAQPAALWAPVTQSTFRYLIRIASLRLDSKSQIFRLPPWQLLLPNIEHFYPRK